jgi:hypothetical protein
MQQGELVAAEHLLSTYSAPSQGIKLFHNYGFNRASAYSPCQIEQGLIIVFITTGSGVSIVVYKESTVYGDAILPCVRVDILNG